MAQFDASFLSPNIKVCTPTSKQSDPETGCGPFCGDNQKIEYETCRQSFYLKQQNEILKQNPKVIIGNEEKIKDAESRNISLRKIVAQQNEQIAQLIQSSKQATHEINTINTINTILIVLLVALAVALLIIKIVNPFVRKIK